MQRVAVHQADGTVFAYKVDGVIDGHHNLNLLSGEVTPVSDIVDGLVEQAREEYPDHSIIVEELHDNDDETSTWVDVGGTKEPAEEPKTEPEKAE